MDILLKKEMFNMAVSHRGAISFGLVHIPVGLYTATQDNDIHFNQLCREDGRRMELMDSIRLFSYTKSNRR